MTNSFPILSKPYFHPGVHNTVGRETTAEGTDNQALGSVEENQILGFDWKCLTPVE
jgi:hypothetical protein